jgi:hypothetical protein
MELSTNQPSDQHSIASPAELLWWLTKDGDEQCRRLYDRHYSRRHYRDGRNSRLFCGPGEKIVLRTWEADAFFVWRRFKDASGQRGICCAIFRNESPHLASELIRQADAVADFVWPRERHYTFVNARRIRSTNPGCCFKAAGWRTCGTTKGGLLILERAYPATWQGRTDGCPQAGTASVESLSLRPENGYD